MSDEVPAVIVVTADSGIRGRQMLRVLTILIALGACARSKEKQPLDLDPEPSVYAKAGVPDPAHAWSTAEQLQAIATVASMPDNTLPHYRAARSGTVFARLVAPMADDNFKNHVLRLEALNRLAKRYYPNQLAPMNRDTIEIFGAIFDDAAGAMSQYQQFLASLPAEEQVSPVRLEGRDKMFHGFSTMVQGTLLVVADERCSADDRLALAEHLKRTAPVMFRYLPAEYRSAMRAQLAERVVMVPPGKLHDVLAATLAALPPE